MRLPRPPIALAGALIVAVAVAVAGLARADEPQGKAAKADPANQKTEGVIVKVEDVAKDKDAPRHVRLTIKTDAVWRDYVRDTTNAEPGASNKKAAEKGQESIATKGQPEGKGDTVVIDVVADTKLESRYRASDDATSTGAETPAGARKQEQGPKDDSRAVGSEKKAPKVECSDLKPGLFVAVEYCQKGDQKPAACVAVLRPVQGINEGARSRPAKGSDK